MGFSEEAKEVKQFRSLQNKVIFKTKVVLGSSHFSAPGNIPAQVLQHAQEEKKSSKTVLLKCLQQRPIDTARKFRETLQWMNGRNKIYFGWVTGIWISCPCWSIMHWGRGWYVGLTAQCCYPLADTLPWCDCQSSVLWLWGPWLQTLLSVREKKVLP